MNEVESHDTLGDIERENLAVHVELSIARYLAQEQHLAEHDNDIKKIKQEVKDEKKFMAKVITIAVAVLTFSATIAVIALDKLR
jgi:hypothetical protein